MKNVISTYMWCCAGYNLLTGGGGGTSENANERGRERHAPPALGTMREKVWKIFAC